MENTSALAHARRRWWIIVLLCAAGAVLGAWPQPEKVEVQSTTYSATHTLLQNDTESTGINPLISSSQIPLFATIGEVPERVAEVIGYAGSPAELATQVSVDYDPSTGALSLSSTQDNPQRAELVADTFAEQLSTYLVERQDIIYQNRLSSFLERLDQLEGELNELSTQLVVTPDDPVIEAQRSAIARQYSLAFEQSEALTAAPNLVSFSTLQTAQAVALSEPGSAVASSRLSRAMMGGVLGGALALAVVVLLGALDRRLRTREQAEAINGIRSRVLVPRVSKDRAGGIVVSVGRHDPLSDAFRTMRNVVGFLHTGLEPVNRGRITVVVSPGSGDGKTSMAANLAAAIGETGQRVVVVNTDFRRPQLSRLINGAGVAPSAFHLAEVDTIDPFWLLRETPVENMMLLDLAGMGSPSELAYMTARLLPRLAELFDAVVVDTSPVAATAEVLEVVPLADVIVLMNRLGHTSIPAAERTVAILRDVSTAPIVLALGGVQAERTGYAEYGDRRGSTDGRQAKKKRRGSKGYTGPERRKTDRRLEEMSVGDVERRGTAKGVWSESDPTDPQLFDDSGLLEPVSNGHSSAKPGYAGGDGSPGGHIPVEPVATEQRE